MPKTRRIAEQVLQTTCECINTSDEHIIAICIMTTDIAQWIINRVKPVVDRASECLDTFYSVEMFDASCEYGQGIEGGDANALPQIEPDQQWRQLPADYEMDHP